MLWQYQRNRSSANCPTRSTDPSYEKLSKVAAVLQTTAECLLSGESDGRAPADLKRDSGFVTIPFLGVQPDKPCISVASAFELYAGVANRREEQQIERLLEQAKLLPVTVEIAKRAGVFVRVFQPSHSVEAIDAIIAATAEHHGLRLATLNVRHFRMFPKLKRAC